MGRPIKWRRVNQMPTIIQFVPSDKTGPDAGQPNADDNKLLIEEYEAIRLKDLEGLEQEECAEQMQISRPTFQRILMTAHQKVADSLINGKGIRIEGGNFTRNVCPVHCLDCGLVWDASIESLAEARSDYVCPRCHSKRIACAPFDPRNRVKGARNRYCQRGCWRNDWNTRLNKEESEREQDADDHHSD